MNEIEPSPSSNCEHELVNIFNTVEAICIWSEVVVVVRGMYPRQTLTNIRRAGRSETVVINPEHLQFRNPPPRPNNTGLEDYYTYFPHPCICLRDHSNNTPDVRLCYYYQHILPRQSLRGEFDAYVAGRPLDSCSPTPIPCGFQHVPHAQALSACYVTPLLLQTHPLPFSNPLQSLAALLSASHVFSSQPLSTLDSPTRPLPDSGRHCSGLALLTKPAIRHIHLLDWEA